MKRNQSKNKEMNRDRFSISKRLLSFRYATKGILYALRTQHNLWIHLTAALLVVGFGIFFSLSTCEWIGVSFAIGMVISAEIFNSSIEKLTDLASPGLSREAGQVKDMAAGAVFIFAITAAIIGLFIFAPKIFAFL